MIMYGQDICLFYFGRLKAVPSGSIKRSSANASRSIAMEDYTAMNGPPLAECLQDVASCEVYVGLFAWRYGFIPNDNVNNPDKKSITELEFLKAESIGIPCYIFILDEKASWPVIHVDDSKNYIRKLRDSLCNSKIVEFFLPMKIPSPHKYQQQ